MATPPPSSYRTIDVRPTSETLIKPGELVDLIEVTPLTLTDRRIYNQLLQNAWEEIDKPVMHVIPKGELRGNHNSNDRIGESIERLMTAIVKMEVIWEGRPAVERVQLLGGNVETARADGLLEYEIPARLRKVITNSTVFARLQREVMFALSSKYALTLYEMVQKRGHLRWKSSEVFSLDGLRAVLGVPRGKLTSWSNLRLRAISPAVSEVCALSDYMVEIVPIKTGRSVTHVDLRWWRKDGVPAEPVLAPTAATPPERAATPPPAAKRTGKARRAETAPMPASQPLSAPSPARKPAPSLTIPGQTPPRPRPAWLERRGAALRSETYETARLRFPGYDIYHIEGQWRDWSAGRTPAEDPDRAFLAFFRKFAEANPI